MAVPMSSRAPVPTWPEIFQSRLEPLLGGFTAQVAVKTVTLRLLKRLPEEVRRDELPAVLDGLRPILITLAGPVHAKVMLDQLHAELASGALATP